VELTVLTFGCQLGLLLPELLFFQRLPLLVFLINIPATLIFSVLISLFWLVLLLLPLPGVAGFLSVPLSSLTGLSLSGIRSLGSLPGLTLWIHTPTWLTILGVVLLFGAACFLVRFRRFLRLSLAVLGSLFLFLSLLPVSHTATEYILFSAGNADAALLWDRERVIVLDTGENDGTLSTFLRANRLTPDAVILSHLHADHAGGLVSMLDDGIPVPLLYLPEGADRQDIHPDFLTLLDRLRSEGTEIRFLARGDVLPLPSGNMSVLWPERNKVRSGQDANDYSLVTRLTLRGSVLLSAADLPGIYESYCAAPADILKAAHHGSRSSTADSFLQQVSPSLVLLSCRQDARLEDFRARVGDIPVFGTPESGAITLRFEENGFSFLPFVSSP
jgi:competence protein ComEC